MFGKSMLSKAYGEVQVPSPQDIEGAGLHLFKNLIEHYPPQKPQVTIDPKTDIAALPYTGGTTGLPKAAVLTHYNMVSLQAQASSLWPFLEEGNEVDIAFLPFFHIYGQVVLMLNGLAQGHTLVLFTTPDIDSILTAIERYKASTFLGVPTLYEYLKEYDKTDRVNWKRLKIIICGADTLHKSTIKDWERRTGTRILEGYGMTETTAVSHSSPYNRPKTGSFGVPIPGMSAAIIGVEGAEFKPVGEDGELILRGPNIMQGYWKRPEANAESFVRGIFLLL
jgi:long-chain acyl-CoA synthetase